MHSEHNGTIHKLAAARDKENWKPYAVEFDHVEMLLCSLYAESTTRKIYKL